MNASLLYFVALGVTAPALKDPPANLSVLMGEWSLERGIASGNGASAGGEFIYTFTKDGKWLIHRGDQAVDVGDLGFTLDPSTDPPHVDLFSDRARPAATRRRGIYKVEGDQVTLCVAAENRPRPTSFESTSENRNSIYVLKRRKP